MIFASNTTACSPQLARLKLKKPPAGLLVDRDEFKSSTVNLPDQAYAIRYFEARLQVQMAMSLMQQYWPMITMFANKEGENLPGHVSQYQRLYGQDEACYRIWLGNQ